MAEFASNGKANAGLTTGIIGTALSGLLTLGSGSILGGLGSTSPRWVSKEEFEQQQTISSLQSENALLKAEQDSEVKMADVYQRLDSKFRTLEASLNEFKAGQGVVNAQVGANIAVAQNQIASLQSELSSLTKTIIPIDNVCPAPMSRYNSWTAPTSTATTT